MCWLKLTKLIAINALNNNSSWDMEKEIERVVVEGEREREKEGGEREKEREEREIERAGEGGGNKERYIERDIDSERG